MPDTGAPWNIPYVAGTDLVADWPTDNQTQAEAIAAALDLAGGLKQVVSTTLDTTFTTSSSTFTALTGLSAAITPSNTSHKVFVLARINLSSGGTQSTMFRLMRGATPISVAATASNRSLATTRITVPGGDFGIDAVMAYLDSPASTSALTYSVDLASQGSPIVVNRSNSDTDTAGSIHARSTSSITLFEVSV